MGSPLAEVQRDGPVQLPASAAVGVRYVQELRGFVPCRFHGRQWRGDVGKGGLLRAQGGGRQGWQEKVSCVSERIYEVDSPAREFMACATVVRCIWPAGCGGPAELEIGWQGPP